MEFNNRQKVYKKIKTMIDRIKSPTAMPIEGANKLVSFEEGDFPNENKPTVLFVGIYSPLFNSDFMVRGFEQAGYRVEKMDWQLIKLNEQIPGLRERLIAKAKLSQPDLIFLHIQNEGVLDRGTVEVLQSVAPTVSYNFDCRPYEQMKWAYDLAPYFELNLFSNTEDVQRCKALDINNCAVLQSSADYGLYKPEKYFSDPNHTEEIVFIGNKFDNTNMKFDNAAERTQMVEFLDKHYGKQFKAWGIGFSRMVKPEEEVVIYNSAKIAVTHNNFLRSRYCSDRGFRAMGCGCLTIHQYYPEINKDFNSHVASTWLNFDMLREQIDIHLENEELRIAKAKAGAEWVRENHSWHKRVLQLQELLKMNK